MRRGCRNLFLTIVCAVIFTMSYTCLVHAATPDDYNYDEIDTSIEEYDIDFKYLVELVMAGKYLRRSGQRRYRLYPGYSMNFMSRRQSF